MGYYNFKMFTFKQKGEREREREIESKENGYIKLLWLNYKLKS